MSNMRLMKSSSVRSMTRNLERKGSEMNILVFVKSKKVFLKVQEGTGDNLSPEDIADGFVDYVLWSTFRPESLGIDGELNMNSIDSGMLMTKEPTTAEKELDDCYCEAFGHQPPEDDILPLMTEVG